MPIYTIDISCRSTEHDYTELFATLRQANALLFMDARWLIDVREDINSVTGAILSHCAVGDGLFVTEIAPTVRWTGTGLGENAKAWIADRSKPQRTVPEADSPTPTPN